jgi:polyhydroxyalkanoate synthase
MTKTPPEQAPEQGHEHAAHRLRPLPVHVALANAAIVKMEARGQDGKALVADMLRGIKLYQDHPYHRPQNRMPVVWRGGTARLYHCAARKPVAAALIVPSMINRAHILDLLPDKSFTRWLAAQGIDVYLLDWGDPADDDAAAATMDDIILNRLIPAIDAAAEQAGRKIPLFGIGYCMGGTLLAAAAARTDKFAGVAFLASPWDFHAGDRVLQNHILAGTPSAMQRMATRPSLPVDWIQSVFAAVNEDRTVHKFANFAAMNQYSREAELFVAVEDWLNDGLDLPAAPARVCITEWYGENRPARGEWMVGGKVVDPVAITVPSLVVAPSRDRLVPADSALALARRLPQAAVLNPDIGHIGMMTGRGAEGVWGRVATWIKTGRA